MAVLRDIAGRGEAKLAPVSCRLRRSGINAVALHASFGVVVLHRFGAIALEASLLAQGFAQNELDLRIDAAQIIIGPALHGFEHGSADSQRIRFFLSRHRACRHSPPAAWLDRRTAPPAGC